jgi:hypothetical protein
MEFQLHGGNKAIGERLAINLSKDQTAIKNKKMIKSLTCKPEAAVTMHSLPSKVDVTAFSCIFLK